MFETASEHNYEFMNNRLTSKVKRNYSGFRDQNQHPSHLRSIELELLPRNAFL